MERDAARLRALLEDLHGEFRGWVSSRRGAKLKAPAEEVFTGRFWPGRRAVELGLADRLGDARGEARRRFGSCHVTRPQGSEAASASVADEVLAWCVLSTDDRETMVAL